VKYIKVKSTNTIHYSGENESELLTMAQNHKDIDGTTYPEDDWEIVTTTEKELTLLLTEQHERYKSFGSKRREEYPPATDYLDGIVKGDQTQIDKYISDCLAIKEKFPKE
jgi:hypothetical protein